jgi:hypothetical protein
MYATFTLLQFDDVVFSGWECFQNIARAVCAWCQVPMKGIGLTFCPWGCGTNYGISLLIIGWSSCWQDRWEFCISIELLCVECTDTTVCSTHGKSTCGLIFCFCDLLKVWRNIPCVPRSAWPELHPPNRPG